MISNYELWRDRCDHVTVWREQNDTFPLHFHSNIELMYVLDGQMEVMQESQSIALSAGALFINSPYLLHGYKTETTSSAIAVMIPLCAVPSLSARLEGQCFRESVYSGSRSRDLLQLIQMLERANDNAELSGMLAGSLLLTLIDVVGLSAPTAPAKQDLLRSILQYIHEHLADELSLPILAREFGYSESRISHLFKERIGCTLCRYIGGLRCRRAYALLASEKLTVLDAAMLAGFENVRSFYRACQREFGSTPRKHAAS